MKRAPPTAEYTEFACLGAGTFKEVYRAKNGAQEAVALAAIKPLEGEGAGVSVETIREIKLLNELQHEHVVQLRKVFFAEGNSEVWLETELGEGDLEDVIKSPTAFLTPSHVKSYLRMLLRGLEYLQSRWVVHRDLKPGNLLCGGGGKLKIFDFGMAVLYGDGVAPTATARERSGDQRVVTLEYRAPELLLGTEFYGPAVDMWSAGCIFGELLLGQMMFPGTQLGTEEAVRKGMAEWENQAAWLVKPRRHQRNQMMRHEQELSQLNCIFAVLGTPSKQEWPQMEHLPKKVAQRGIAVSQLRERLSGHCSEEGMALLESMLHFNPEKRPSPAEALRSAYFSEEPPPTPPAGLKAWLEASKAV